MIILKLYRIMVEVIQLFSFSFFLIYLFCFVVVCSANLAGLMDTLGLQGSGDTLARELGADRKGRVSLRNFLSRRKQLSQEVNAIRSEGEFKIQVNVCFFLLVAFVFLLIFVSCVTFKYEVVM